MIGRVERVILAALADIVFDPATPSALVALVRRVEPMRHSYFSLGPDQGRSSPDASYGHLEACWPSVVIEVSYSQKKKDLKELARDYIFHSQANVRLVVGIDIDYRRTKVGVVSVWRAERSYLPDGRLHLAARRVVTNQVSLLLYPIFVNLSYTEMTCDNPTAIPGRSRFVGRRCHLHRPSRFSPPQLDGKCSRH